MFVTTPNDNWAHWRERFAARQDRPLPVLETDHDYRQLPRSVARSLAVFQLGESGGGTVVDQARDSQLPGVNADYAEAVRLFVAEEHRHADILGMCVRLTGGELLRQNWTARLFVRGRRLMGLRLKVLVLLAAEVVGIVFYRQIARRLPAGVLRRWLEELVDDERMHFDFHCAFLRSQVGGRLGQLVFVCAWRLLMVAAGVAVLSDHRRTLRDLYIDPREVWQAWSGYRLAVERKVLCGDHKVTSPAPEPADCTRPCPGRPAPLRSIQRIGLPSQPNTWL